VTLPAPAQLTASDPARSVFVTANAGSGKTSTLVRRVARLLLRGAAPETILCVTYTKAAAAEMQRRLFDELGGWAVMENDRLRRTLAELGEWGDDLGVARALFARALETPGGLKIQTIHAFCEKLLKRFPLEAGISPGFQVLEEAGAAELSALAKDRLAEAALIDATLGDAYAHFSVALDWRRFNDMFVEFQARRAAVEAYIEACRPAGGFEQDVWSRCGFETVTPPEEIEAETVAGIDWAAWGRAVEALGATSSKQDAALAAAMAAVDEEAPFEQVRALFHTQAGEPSQRLATNAVDPASRTWLQGEQKRIDAAYQQIKAARVARNTVWALGVADTYLGLYDGAKAAAGALDFADLIERTHALLTVRADAAWVLYKLDGGVDHLLLDEAQDTAPDQWDILHALTDEFFAGAGARGAGRTIFAVGDQKQSIYSFQGAAPEQFVAEAGAFRSLVEGAGLAFDDVPLLESWRSTPEVLSFVDAVFADPEAAAGLSAGAALAPVLHRPSREPGFGGVDAWPLFEGEALEETDPWAPVDAEPPESANKKLARALARAIKAQVAAREAVFDRESRRLRAAHYGDFLILVRRRGALFHEIIRALKREDVAVGGADRLRLSEHVVFKDLVALGRFARYPDDDLTLAALLRSPFCAIDEESLFDLAYGRKAPLWATLQRRAGERPAWAQALGFLAWAKGEAALRPPFDFFSRTLSRLDGAGRSMRERMLGRLGREAEDAIDAFLGEALNIERLGIVDLERFLGAMAQVELEVKREQDDASTPVVRVMTVHGAKGLEAPIVVLPDTTIRARAMGGPMLACEDGGFLWSARKADDCPASAAARAQRETAADHESLRLLYVALTRARDRLMILGTQSLKQHYLGSWHDVVTRALGRPEIADHTRPARDGEVEIVRFGADPVLGAAARDASSPPPDLPAWARRLAPAEPLVVRYTSPTALAERERGAAPSPLAEHDGLGRYRRGLLIHRLLQLLPDVAPEARARAAAVLLAKEQDLTEAQRQEMATAALGVLHDARFAAVFGPGSRAEVALAGLAADLPAGLAISGRIDRLVVEDARVLAADFKTNRPAPERIEDADPAYLIQMAAYAAVLREVFPGRRVETALIWTDGPKLMPIPEKIVDETLASLRRDA
jgi:ATP-dependent helicase/nuclease subunit A